MEMPQNVAHSSLASASQDDITLQSRAFEMRAVTREIRGPQVRSANITVQGRQIREEDLKTLIFCFLLLTGIVLLTLRQVSVHCYHSHSHGKISIVRYIHLQDGQK